MSIEIESEIAEKLRIKFKLNKEETDQILLDFLTFTIPVKINKRFKAILKDPEDNKFIECAVASMADYIVSGDKHLLELKEFAGIKILTASECIAILKKNLK